MILICFDGSPDSEGAVDCAAALMPKAEAVVLTIWEPFVDMLTRCGATGMGFGMAGSWIDNGDADVAAERGAVHTAMRGTERATAAGLLARPHAAQRSSGVERAILNAAEKLDAELVVLGTRGLSGVKSLVLGSVSHAVVHHADRPVLIVPSPSLIALRRDWVAHADATVGIA
jgi:nucleotide-binding universal stress UspA family protein